MNYSKAIKDISADNTIGSKVKARMILPLVNPEAGRAVLRSEVGSALALLGFSPEMIEAERAAAAARVASRK